MNFFTRKVPWATWQFGVLKLSMITLGIVLGAIFADFWRPYLWLVGLVFVITAVWVTVIWLSAMRKSL